MMLNVRLLTRTWSK